MELEVAEAERLSPGLAAALGSGTAAAAPAAVLDAAPTAAVPLRIALRSLEAVRDLGSRLRLREACPLAGRLCTGSCDGAAAAAAVVVVVVASLLLLLLEVERRLLTSRKRFIPLLRSFRQGVLDDAASGVLPVLPSPGTAFP